MSDRRACTRVVAAGLALVAGAAGGPAASQTAVPEGWRCQFCPFETGLSATWSFGSTFVSDDSGKFGDYTGFNDKGFYALGDAELRNWSQSGSYWELLAQDLGLDSRALTLDGGRPGVYRLEIVYDEIPKYRVDGAMTPFRRAGSNKLVLPAGWIDAGSTAAMAALSQSLARVDIARDRKTLGVGLAWLASGKFDYRAHYRRVERSGTELLAGSFAASSALLPAPIDYVTDEVEFGMSRSWSRGTLDAAYFGSSFSNRAAVVDWDNPFTPLAFGADTGRLALEPDNTAHQLRVSGSYRFGSRTRLSASLASGRLEQDDVLAAFTINPAVVTVALPRRSLDGLVETRRVSIDLVAQPLDRLRVMASYNRDERDNKTPQAVYDYVLTDLAPAGARTNLPYGFDHSGASVSADYRLPRGLRLAAGFDRDIHERSLQARARSEQDSAWTKLSWRDLDWVQASVVLTDRWRDGSDYRQVDLGAGLQNPLMRQYHLADRDQRIAALDLALVPHERVNVLIRAERTRDEYPESQLGLTEGRSSYYSLDASVDLPGGFDVYAAWGREEVQFEQAGSQGFGAPDWFAATDDTTNTRSLGLTKMLLDERMRLRLDLTDSRSRGETEVRVGAPAPDFPDFTTSLRALSLELSYDISEALAMRVGYRNERFSSADWQLDGLGLTTLTNVLTAGAQSPRYNIDLLSLSFAYTPSGD